MIPVEVKERMINEDEQLCDKITKLVSFLYNKEPNKSQVDKLQIKLMKKQLVHMVKYEAVLAERIEEN